MHPEPGPQGSGGSAADDPLPLLLEQLNLPKPGSSAPEAPDVSQALERGCTVILSDPDLDAHLGTSAELIAAALDGEKPVLLVADRTEGLDRILERFYIAAGQYWPRLNAVRFAPMGSLPPRLEALLGDTCLERRASAVRASLGPIDDEIRQLQQRIDQRVRIEQIDAEIGSLEAVLREGPQRIGRLRETLGRAKQRTQDPATGDPGLVGDDIAQRAMERARTTADALEGTKTELHAAVDRLDTLFAQRVVLPQESRETIARCHARLEDLKQRVAAASEDAVGARMVAECELIATTFQDMPSAILKRDFDLVVVSLAPNGPHDGCTGLPRGRRALVVSPLVNRALGALSCSPMRERPVWIPTVSDSTSSIEVWTERFTELDRRSTVRDFCKVRGIRRLVHFTRAERLPSVLARGLVTRQQLEAEGHTEFTDASRLDGLKNSISLSIEFPNYKMFTQKRGELGEDGWVVICVDASVLWELDCIFVPGNAALKEAAVARDPGRYRNVRWLEAAFADDPACARLKSLPPQYPTNPQMEVMVREGIPPRYIRTVQFRDSQLLEQCRDCCPLHVSFVLQPGGFNNPDRLFGPRLDHEQWKKPELRPTVDPN